MKAKLKNDMIINVSLSDGTEIGNIPNGVPLDQLRWDGDKLIDLAAPANRHVKYLGNGFFEIHVTPLHGTQQIHMNYKQRRDLRYDDKARKIYLASETEKKNEVKQEVVELTKSRIKNYIGKDIDLFMKHFALTAALIVYASSQPQKLKDFFDILAPHIKDAFPIEKWEEILIDFAKDIRNHLTEYYKVLDDE